MTYCTTYKAATAVDNLINHLQRFRAVLCVLCLMFGLGYFWQINSLSTRGYKIRDLQNSIEILKEESQDLELQAASAQSWARLEERVKQLNMVDAAKVEYLNPVGSGVALAR